MESTQLGKMMFIRLIYTLVFTLFLASTSIAENPPAETPAIQENTVTESPKALASPRATMETFLHAMNDFKRGSRKDIQPAIDTLDLSEINSLIQQEEGRDLAWTLLEVLDRTRVISPSQLPAKADAPSPYTFERYPGGAVEISQQSNGRWLFSARTVSTIPVILDDLTKAGRKRIKVDENHAAKPPLHLRLRSQLPESLLKKTLLLENWQWIAGFLFVLIGVLADKITSVGLKGLVLRWNQSRYWRNYQSLPGDMLRPFGLMAMAGVWWYSVNLMGLESSYRLVLLVAAKFLAGLATVWSAYRLVDLAASFLHYRASLTDSKLDDALVPLLSRTLKIFITLAGLIFLATILRVNVTNLIAGLGIGGLAFALAAKDMVQNLFGSITVLTDRTFMVGDWILVGETEGTIEEIGFRSTRIRTFYNSIVSVPNSRFITAEVDNMGKRTFRRYKTNLSLACDTPPEKIEAFCAGARELVLLHPAMRKDYFHIYLNEFTASSLNVLVYVFFQVPDWGKELEARHQFMIDLLELAKRLKIEFTYPVQTVYLREDKPAEHQSLGMDNSDHLIAKGKALAAASYSANPARQGKSG